MISNSGQGKKDRTSVGDAKTFMCISGIKKLYVEYNCITTTIRSQQIEEEAWGNL